MNNYLEIHDPPIFSTQVTKVTEDDLITDELENDIKGKLLNNNVFIKALAEKLAEKLSLHIESNEIHVTSEKTETWDKKADKELATQNANGLMAAGDKSKIDNISEGADVNQLAINNLRVGNTNVYSNAKEGQIILRPSGGITITGDNATKVVTIGVNMPTKLPANGGHASTCDRAFNADNATNANNATYATSANSANTCNRSTNSNWADGATNANAVRGFAFAVAIQAAAPGDGNALWVW